MSAPLIPAMTLYRIDGACSISAHMLLRELNLPFKDVPLHKPTPEAGYEPLDGSLTRAGFLALNPSGYVPTLLINDPTDNSRVVLTELPAILVYLTGLAQTPTTLLGTTPLENARVLEWLIWASITLNEYGFAGKWASHRMIGHAASREAVEAVRLQGDVTLRVAFVRIEEKILANGGPHAMGEQMTVVDLTLHTFWRWGVASGYDMRVFKAWERAVRAVEELASVQETLAAENLPLSFPPGTESPPMSR